MSTTSKANQSPSPVNRGLLFYISLFTLATLSAFAIFMTGGASTPIFSLTASASEFAAGTLAFLIGGALLLCYGIARCLGQCFSSNRYINPHVPYMRPTETCDYRSVHYLSRLGGVRQQASDHYIPRALPQRPYQQAMPQQRASENGAYHYSTPNAPYARANSGFYSRPTATLNSIPSSHPAPTAPPGPIGSF